MEQNNETTEVQPQQPGIFGKYPALKPVVGALALVLFVATAFVLRDRANNVQPSYSSADCYGVDCTASVSLGGRAIPYGYDSQFSYGTLYVRAGESIELTWFGDNVDTCKADKGWTSFKGIYLPPTLLERKLPRSQTLSVSCYQGKRVVVTGSLNVVVEK